MVSRRGARTCQLCQERRTSNPDRVCNQCREGFEIVVPNDGYTTVKTTEIEIPATEIGDRRKGTGFVALERDPLGDPTWRPYP